MTKHHFDFWTPDDVLPLDVLPDDTSDTSGTFDYEATLKHANEVQQADEDLFHNEVLAALKTGQFDEFAAPYLNEDGTSNWNLFFATNQLHEALVANDIDPSQYDSTAHEWLMGH